MKLLGWMHRMLTFRQNNINETASRDFSIGNSWCQSSVDDLQCYYQKGSYNGCKPSTLRKAERDNNYLIRNNPFSLEEEESESAAITDLLFHGFLAIGTLGTDPTAASTPTFSIAEKETEATDNELKLINDELEKILMRDEIISSSGRNSDIGRMSYCSTITLSGKQPIIESSAIINTCPLQSYLFGSTVMRPQKTSLGELFQKTKQAEENSSGTRSSSSCIQKHKETDKSSALLHVMKKMSKRRTSGAGRRTTTLMDSSTPEQTKLQKILHIFNRKVHHDENSTSCNHQKTHKPTKIEIKNNKTHLMESTDHEDIIIYPQPAISKESCKNQSQLTKIIDDTTTGNHEFWVKTDADCFLGLSRCSTLPMVMAQTFSKLTSD